MSTDLAPPPDGPVLSRTRAARRQRLLDAARETFLRDGYHGATMERVAEDAGVSKQTLYNYFPDKDALFIALMERVREGKAHPTFDEALDRIAAGDAETGLRNAFIDSLPLTDHAEQDFVFRLGMEVAAERPEVMGELWDKIVDRAMTPFRGALALAIQSGYLRDIDI
jgi:AcrR family transcriptional regulator